MNGARRIAQMASYPRWGGGIHVNRAAEQRLMQPHEPRLWQAIWQARQRGLIDIYRGWVIAEQPDIDQRRGCRDWSDERHHRTFFIPRPRGFEGRG
jgi:hypothetical protein